MVFLRQIRVLSVMLLLAACYEPVAIEESACDASGHPCPDGYLCVHEACFRSVGGVAVACMENVDCPAGVCLREAHVCVGCMKHSQCVSGLCSISTHICIGCKADYQCPSGDCDEERGICATPVAENATRDPATGN